jgi:hypothetical protein
MKKNNCIISIHIPKTGGGTFGLILERIYKDWFLKTHRPDIDIKVKDIESPYKGVSGVEDKIGGYDIIHGHFLFNEDLCNKGYDYITLLREPVGRFISHYLYHHWQVPDEPYTIKEWCDMFPNLMTAFTGGDVSNYKFIGILEKWERSLETFGRIFDKDMNVEYYNRNVNTSDNKKTIPISDDDIKMIKEYNQKDIQFYKDAVEHWGYDV